jgi:hypothetical protein
MAIAGFTCAMFFLKLMNLYSAYGITLLAKKKAITLSKKKAIRFHRSLQRYTGGFHSCKLIVFAKFPKVIIDASKMESGNTRNYSRHREHQNLMINATSKSLPASPL